MGRKRSPDSLLNYFPEQEMIETLKLYQETKSEKYYEILQPKLIAVINGMINKEFSYNTFVKGNRDMMIAECLFEIFQSYHRFDPAKGRLFAYTNRIIKNTLIKHYNQFIKLSEYEPTYSSINAKADVADNGDYGDDNIINLSIIANGTYVDDNFKTEDNIALDIVESKKVLSEKDTIRLVYDYLKLVNEAISYFCKKGRLSSFINSIKYETNINFDFTKYYTVFCDEQHFYSNLLEILDYTINKVLKWIESKYCDIIHNEPTEYNGQLSTRVLDSIHHYIITSVNNGVNTQIDLDNLVGFIKYITAKRYMS